MKRSFIIVPSVLVVVVGGLLVAPGFVDWNKYKPEATAQIKKATGFDIALNGDLGLTILPSPRLTMESVEVAAPAGSTADHLARLKRLDVNLSLGALLQGKIDFSSVTLVEPDIALEVFSDGRQNWMTPELQQMTAKNPDGTAQPARAPDIALRGVHITKGTFSYKDAQAPQPTLITDADLDLGADTLKGPFKISGRFGFGGQTVKIDATTGALLEDMKSLSLKGEASMDPMGASIRYAGVAGLEAPYESQGEAEIALKDLDKMTQGAVRADHASIKGMVTASQDKVIFKDATMTLGDNTLTGDLAASFKPVKIVGRLAAAKTVNLDDLIQPAPKGKAGGNILPASIELPLAFDMNMEFTLPGMVYRNQPYKDVALTLIKDGGVFKADFAAGQIPGPGAAHATADLSFGSKSISKTGAEVYSEPVLTGTIDGQTQNIARTVEDISGMAIPALSSWKTASMKGGFTVRSGSAELTQTTLRIDDMPIQVSGSYATRGSRPAVVIDLAAETLNFDELQKKFGGESAPGSSLEDSLKALALPYDVDFDIGVQNARMQGYDIKGLRAQGSARENAMKFTNLSAQNVAGASFKLAGGINDVKGLKGIDVTFSGQSDDPRGVAKIFKVDTASWPQNLKSASVSATLSGGINQMAVKAAVDALNGSLGMSGDVANPLTDMKISGMTVTVKHSNFSEALKMLSPSAPQYASWRKPFEVSADVSTEGKMHNFRNIKGSLAGASIAGQLSYDQTGAKPAIKGNLEFGDVVMVSSAGAAAAATSTSKSQAPATGSSGGRWSEAPMDSAWMHNFDADLSIKARSLTYETWNLQNPVLAFNVQNGALNIRQLESGLYGGSLAMSGSMQSAAGGKGPVSVDGKAQFKDVSVEELTASLARGARLIKGQGRVTMDADLKSTGSSQKALVANLSGKGDVSGKDIVLEGFDLARFGKALSDENRPGETLSGLWRASIKGGSTPFDTLKGNYTVTQGIVTINKLDADGPTALLATTGTINLPAWTIATKHDVTLRKYPDIPPFSINISGSLDNPGNTFGQGVLQDYVQRKINRKLQGVISEKLGDEAGGALGALLGIQKTAPAAGDAVTAPAPAPVTPDANVPAAQPVQPVAPAPAAQPTPEEAIQGVLEGLLNKH